MRRRVAWAATALALLVGAVGCESNVPDGFHEYVVFERLDLPTALAFAPDGRIFVAEKRGVVKVFDGALDDTPSVFADLRTDVHNSWDRGLLDVAVPPNFATNRAVYVLYTYDAPPGETAPYWGTADSDADNCPDPPGANTDGCVVTARLGRLPLAPDGRWTGQHQVLVHDWCQQYPGHSIGTIAFGADGALYAGGGDGASYSFWDYGQRGDPPNPCGDPPAGVGGQQTPPTAQGGSLRSQDLRTTTDPAGLDGAIIRVDPISGAARPDNPLAGSPDANARRIVAYGFRNPFRFTVRPGTSELWVGDVGSGGFEEIDRSIGDDAVVDNFGWPCYEGTRRVDPVDQLDLALCEALYAAGPGADRDPWWSYAHGVELTPDERCTTENGSSLSGVAFAPGDSAYPDPYDGALFLADASRGCIWSMERGVGGLPDPDTLAPFVTPAGTPVDVSFAPSGELWYVDLYGGRIVRIGYSDANRPPDAVVRATPDAGDPPLTVSLDASASSDPDPGDTQAFAWDLDDDGAFDDATGPTASTTFTEQGLRVVRVRVTDRAGASTVGVVVVTVGDPQGPVALIEEPDDAVFAAVGDAIGLRGFGTDPDGNLLPAEAMSWSVDLLHCPSACHRHPGVFRLDGRRSGSFAMPDHEYPAAAEVRLTVEWNGRTATATRRVDYLPTDVTMASQPAGVTLSAGSTSQAAPFTRTFATNGLVTLTAPATATVGGVPHVFASWSDGGSRTHEIVVPESATTYTARYVPAEAVQPSG
ncbi:MAG: PQQ-dependent sugar dehydrogenase [Acidimicrobiales bacterium]